MMIGDILPLSDSLSQPVRSTQNDHIDDLWDGLNLGGLLNDLQQENDALMRAKRMKDPFYKQKKVLESPAYSVLMDRYHTRPPQPKLLTKKTLDRLSDPIKGRIYESPPKQKAPKEDISDSREQKYLQSVDVRTKLKPEKIQKEAKIIPNKLPIRYHSPIRRDSLPDDEDPIGEENSPSNISVKKDSDSFFLTGTGHGEVDTRSHQRQGYEGYHPVMDVRIEMDPSHQKSNGRNAQRDPDEIYTSRTREYLQDALRRGKSGGKSNAQISERSRDVQAERIKSQRNEQNFQKEITKRIRGDITKPKQGTSRREKSNLASKRDGPRERAVQREKKPHVSSSRGGTTKASEKNSSKWASSREVPVTKPVPARKLLAPVAGLQTRKSKIKKQIPSSENLVGLERVDDSYVPPRARRIENPNPTILRSNSSSAARTKSDPLKSSLPKSSLIGSRSAPTISSRKNFVESNPNLVAESEENKPAYHLHAPAPSRLLPGRHASAGINSKRSGSAQRNIKVGVTLEPLPSMPNQLSGVESGNKIDAGDNSRTRSQGKNTIGRPPLSSQSQSISRTNSKKVTEIDPADDQMAALFAAHAKKLSDNLDKASSLSMKYQRLKEFDGLTASQRDYSTTSTLLPLPLKKLDSISESTKDNKMATGEEAFDVPPRLSMII